MARRKVVPEALLKALPAPLYAKVKFAGPGAADEGQGRRDDDWPTKVGA